MKIYVIHENNEWTGHLFKRLEELSLPYEDWHMAKGKVNLSEEPPKGIFYNRMSASSHTRGHRYAPELTNVVLNWLEFHGRKVLNGKNALSLEINKTAQYLALESHGIKVPKTVAALGKQYIVDAAASLNVTPFITKHNRAGKGLGVILFRNISELEDYVNSPNFEDSIDGITLIQEYIRPQYPYIIRSEFIGGRYLYSVRVDTRQGFENCPADACQVGDLFCPIGEDPKDQMKFKIIEHKNQEQIRKYEEFLKSNKIDIAGIEFIEDENNNMYTYDVNTNTNYNSDAENKHKTFAMLEIAKYLGSILHNS